MKYLLLLITISCTLIACNGDIWGRMPPHADFKVLNDGCEAPCKLSFINTSTGNANSYNWFFPTTFTGFSTEESPEQIFNEPGIFEIQLNAANSAGFSSVSRFVTIQQPQIKPLVDFNMIYPNFMQGGSCEYPCQVTFENKTLGAGATYLWDFGDGITSTEENPGHTYLNIGKFIVSLTATNTYGTSIGTREINILPQFQQTKIISLELNNTNLLLPSFDIGEQYPHTYPDLYLNVQYSGNYVIQNRDLTVLYDVQNAPVTIYNNDDKFLSYYETYGLNLSDFDSQVIPEYDPIVFQIGLNPSSFSPFIQELTYPDNSKHWIANVPLLQFTGVNATLKLEYF